MSSTACVMAACAASPPATDIPRSPAPTSIAEPAEPAETGWVAAVASEAQALQVAHPAAEVRIVVLDESGTTLLASHADVATSKPTGSTIKPLTIYAALTQGLDPALEIDGSAPFKLDGDTIEDSRNNGVMTLPEAIAKSSNIAVPRVLQTVVWRDVYVQVGTLVPLPDPQGMSLRDAVGQLGGFETAVSLRELVSAYAQMSTTPEGERVLEMLRLAVTEEGTGSAAAVNGLDVLGKTGTSWNNDVQGAVFVGRVRHGDTNTWIGVSVHGVARDAYGGSVAAPAFAHIIEAVLR